MATKINIIRAACFSHSEPYLVSGKGHYQVLVKLTESQRTQKFTVDVSLFNLGTCSAMEKKENFENIGAAMDWVITIFEEFEEHAPPEVLYLPKWEDEENVNNCVKVWADTIFNQDPDYKLIRKSAIKKKKVVK